MVQPTIFISGWAHGAEVMRPLASALGTESAVCVSPAELGAEGAAADGLSPYAAALASRLRTLPAPVTLAGWSTGGMIALETALAAPERVSRLVLLAATARFSAADGYACGLPAGNLRALAAGVARMPAAALKGFLELAAAPEALAPAELAGRLAAALAQGTESLKGGLAYLRDCDLRGRVGGLRVPCLAVHGREDRVVSCGASEFLAAAIPGCCLVLLDGAGHDLPRRHAARVAMVLSDRSA